VSWRRTLRRGLTPTLALLLAFAAPAAADAEPLRMANLRVDGGEEAWHPESSFEIDWDQVPGPPIEPSAVLYRLYDQNGEPLAGPVRETRKRVRIDSLLVPPAPGAYRLEIWLEDARGEAGPPAFAQLRFDDQRPPPPAPLPPAAWLTSNEEARLRIGHPQGRLPVSGIRGYAVSLDQGGGSSPCALAGWCSDPEIDLGGGIDDDLISLGALPQGTTFARVVAVSGSGVASPVATVPFEVDATPPTLALQGLPDGWSDGPVRVSALARDQLSGMGAAGPNGPFTAIAVDGRAPTIANGDGVSAWIAGSGIHRVAYFGRDAAGNANDGRLGPKPAGATVAIDEEPPRVLFAAVQDPAEPERVEATVADPLSGPSSARGAIGVRAAGAHGRFEGLPTQVAAGRLVAHWDSDAYPSGKYEFLATGYDRAGNAASGGQRERGGRMVLVNPLKEQVRIEAGFGGRARERIAPYGRAVRFSGRLQGPSGKPLRGLEVTVREVFAAGSAPEQRAVVVRTDADGVFAIRLAPGPTRDVSASFAGTPTLTRAAAASVRLDVRSGLRFRASAATARIGGAPIRFSGVVGAAGAARGVEGLPVELQFRYPGAGWSEFRTLEANSRGRFRYLYRFSDDDSRGVRFQFRAVAGQREGWPYEPAFSRPVAVTGR
jgi:hypothetical protein